MQEKLSRNEQGLSLAGVMALGLALTMMVTAAIATILPAFRSINRMNNETVMRNAGDGAVDYAVAMMNTQQPGWDLGAGLGANVAVGTSTNKTISNAIHGNNNATVNVTISSPGNPPAGSMLFDPLLIGAGFNNSYRMLRVDVNQAGVARSVRTLMQPIIGFVGGGGNPGGPGGPGNNPPPNANGTHGYAMFGVASIIYAGQAGLDTYNVPAAEPWLAQTGADGGSLGKISQVWSSSGGMTRANAQGGSHYEFPNPLSYYNQQFKIAGQTYNAKPATSAQWMSMYGNVWSNGANTAYYPLLGPSDPGGTANYSSGLTGSNQTRPNGVFGNVFGMQNGVEPDVWNPLASSQTAGNKYITQTPNPSGNMTQHQMWKGGSVGFNENGGKGYSYPQPVMPAGEAAPQGSFDLGAVNLKSGAKLIIDHTAPAPTVPINTISGTSKTVTIPPGNYKMSSLTLSGSSGGTGAKIEIAPATQAAIAAGNIPPVNFYLEGTSTPATAMSVDNASSINMNGISGTSINFTGNTGYPNTKLSNNQIAINKSSGVTETSGGASQLHIHSTFGNGAKIILQGKERAVIDAPMCDVVIGSILNNGSPVPISNDAHFYGSAYAGNIAIQSAYTSGGGAFVHYDWKLHPPGRNNPWGPMAPNQNGGNNNGGNGGAGGGGGGVPQQVTGYRAVSWQETINTINGAGNQWTWQ